MVKLLYELYVSDKYISFKERNDLNKKMKLFNITFEEIEDLSLYSAINILKKNKFKKELLYILIANWIFIDTKFKDEEEYFVNKLIEKYKLDKTLMFKRIKEAQNKKLDEILSNWIEKIDKTEKLC